MGDLLPVMDDFERAIAHAEANGDAGLLDGVKAISTKLSESLGKHGLETIDPRARRSTRLSTSRRPGRRRERARRDRCAGVPEGLSLGKKVIRPAMVTISTGGPKREVESDDAE